VLRELHSRFNGQRVSKGALEAFLRNYPPEELGSLHFYLAGWVVDEKPHCFLWNGGYPEELFYEPEHVVGSGESFYGSLFEGGFSNITPRASGTDEAIYHALCRASMLTSAEILGATSTKEDFGFAYEVLFFDGDKFDYVDNILFLTWDVYWDDVKKASHFTLCSTVLKYRSFVDYSVVQAKNLPDSSYKIHTITPIYDDMPGLLTSIPVPGIDIYAGEVFTIESDYYCLFLRLASSDGASFSGPIIFTGDDQDIIRVIRTNPGSRSADKVERLSFQPSFIQHLHSRIKKASDPRRIMGFNLYRSADPNLPKSLWKKINEGLITDAEFIEKADNRQPGVHYYYYATTVNGFGIESVPSDIIETKAGAVVSTPFLGSKSEP
jgi:hypothetical protein